MNRWTVHKFGGSSLAGVDEFARVARIVADAGPSRRAVVVSAPAGVTDRLLGLLALELDEGAVDAGVVALRQDLTALVDGLVDGPARDRLAAALDRDLDTIRAVVASTRLLRAVPPEAAGLVSGFGESWSARLLAARVEVDGAASAAWLDARRFLVVGPGELGPAVDWSASSSLLTDALPTWAPTWW